MEQVNIFAIIIPVGTAIVGVIGGFYAARYKLLELMHSKHEELREKIHGKEIELERLKGQVANHEQIISVLQQQVLSHVPAMFELLKEEKKNGNKK